MENKKYYLGGIFTGILIAILVGSGIYAGKQIYDFQNLQLAPVETAAQTVEEDGTIVNDNTTTKMDVLQQSIEEYYYEDVDVADLEEGIYDGILDAIGDPYSEYYSPEELAEIMSQTQGIYYGIGAYIGIDPKTELPQLSGIIEGSPAEESGLKTGDFIYKVDGEEIMGQDLSEVISKVKGEEGTTVTLTIIRDGASDYMEVTVTRRKIESPTVTSEMYDDGIGYLRISEFDEVTLEQFTTAYTELNNSNMKGMVLDLRDNPGGNLSTVVEIARQILPEGMIVYTEDKYGAREEYTCDGTNEIQIPMVVLVNGYSASASEILAGAIKDYGIGTLLGTTTFGKGIVQRIISISDGSAVKLTVSRYFTPSGNNIHGVGIEPDETLELDTEKYLEDETDNQLNRAIEILTGEIEK